jgi:hypothetical protein
MSKRSTRVAKRGEFERALKAIEDGLRSRRVKSTPFATPEASGDAVEHPEAGCEEPPDDPVATANVKSK